WDWSYMENEEEDHALVADQEAPIEFALMAKSSFDNEGNSQNYIKDKGYWDSGSSRHMTGNISYLSNFEIDEDDIKEMDIKWNMALLSMRADRFWKKTGKKISIQGTDVAGFDKSKVEYFNCHKMGHFAKECRAPRSQDKGRRENYKQGLKQEEQAPKALMAIDGVGWIRATWQMKKRIMLWLLMKKLLHNLP
nr:hypothetical protein [Tanacetum cinerariifolium]